MKRDSNGIAIGVGVGIGVPVLLIIGTIGIFVALRQKRNQRRKSIIDLSTIDYEPSQTQPSMKISSIPGNQIVVGEKLGSGNFGSVYKGKWGGTEVALKQIDGSGSIDDEIKILG